MTDSVFDVALEKRFTDSAEIATIDVTSADTLLIRDSATGAIMRLPFSTLASAISSAFGSSFASLVDGKVPASQLPSYVDDVLEYANMGAFPVTGETGKIYVALDTNKTYRWSGSAYVEISASLALGETSSTAYRGDRGKTAYDHSQATGNPHGTTKADVGLSNVDNTSDANKPVSTAQQTALNAKADKADAVFSGQSIKLPIGTTAQRPTGATGLVRMNSTTNRPEWYDPIAQTWVSFNATEYDIEYFVLGGAGGGGGAQGGIGTYNTGGGGGGGYVAGTFKVFSGSTYAATVGNGGNGGTGIGAGGVGSDGQQSSFAAIVAGGGKGATLTGGGASGSPQNNAGGVETASATWGAGGGGGAGGVGSNGTSTNGGNGGNGVEWPSGSGVYYGGGGGGGIYYTGTQTPGLGGTGGGANAPTGNGNGNNGTANKGGGGSGAGAMGGAGSSNYTGGAGGSGVVIIRYSGSQRGTGGVVTSSGGYTYHTLNSSAEFTA